MKAVGIQPEIDYRNFSDHLPINLTFNAAFIHSLTTAKQGIGGSESKENDIEGTDTICFNWKSANFNIYYDRTRMVFEPILSLMN